MCAEIHLIHGCAQSWRPDVQAMRNYVPEEALRRYFNACSCPCGALSSLPHSTVLTIDDSTNGAARACTIAREAGHEVTLFINPAQVARRRCYWFSIFDALLDARQAATVTFGGREWDLSLGRDLRMFRLAAKSRLMALPENETDGLLDEIAVLLQTGAAVVAEHALTMTFETLRELVQMGVYIGNHGWDHRDIAAMSAEELSEDLQRARAWFQSCGGISHACYAVPYGVARFPNELAQEITGMVLLADPEMDVGYHGEPALE